MIVKAFESKYPHTKCKYCARPISIGSKIIWCNDSRGKGRSYHPACWDTQRQINPYYAATKLASEYPIAYASFNRAPSLEETETENETIVTQETAEQQNHYSEELSQATSSTPVTPEFIPNVPATDAQTAIESLAQVLIAPLASQIQKLDNLDAKVDAKVSDAVLAAISTLRMEAIDTQKIIELIEAHAVKRVVIENTVANVTYDVGIQHEQFPLLVKLLSTGLNVWLMGPAGTGKTTACENAAKALNLTFCFTGALAEPYGLLGYKDAHGVYQRTPFRDAYENGGLFLYDEIDGSEPQAVLPFNAALANGHCAFPDGIIPKHANFRCVAAANTWGLGGTNEYVGRLKQDAAVLDRFIKLPWEVDEKLESALAQNDAWVSRVRAVRSKVAAKGIKVLVTPRASIFGAKLLASGIDQKTVETLVLKNGMTPEQWSAVGA